MKSEIIKNINLEIDSFPQEKLVVYTYGAWDLLHPGHIIFLNRAKELGHYLVVGVISDNAIKELKGSNRPIQKESDRLFIVEHLSMVDRCLIQEEYDPSSILRGINRLDILTKGDDWDYIPGQETIVELGGKMVKLSYTSSYSTSKTVEKLTGIKKTNKEY